MPPRRRLLLLIDRLEDGGAERQFCELVRGLARAGRHDFTVGIVERRPGFYEWALEGLGVPIVRFGRDGRLRPHALRALVRELRKNHYDLLHAWKPLACDYALLAGRWCGIPIVLSSIRNAADHDWKHRLRTRLHARFADRLVANSRAGFDRFGTMRAHFVVIRNGVDAGRFEIGAERRAQARGALAVAPGDRLVVMAASFTEKKDHATLLEAFARVAATRPDLHLVLAGRGPRQPAIQARAAALGLAGRVHFPGFVQASEDLLANAAVSVLLTDARRHKEGISNSLVESMALGVPVVATAGGGTDEVIEDGVSGLLVPSGDAAAAAGALARLLDDAALRERLAAGARRKVTEAFGLERFLREHQDLYESVLAAAPDGAPASPVSPPSPR